MNIINISTSFLITISFYLVLFFALLISIDIIKTKCKQRGSNNKVLHTIENIPFLNNFSKNLEDLLKDQGKESLFSYLLYGSLIFAIFIACLLFKVKQTLLAVIFPFFLIYLLNKICIKMKSDFTEEMEEQLPIAIDNIIRIWSKYSDVKTVFTESSKLCKYPIRDIFEDIARKMITESPKEVLMQYTHLYDSVWFYSFVFIIISYLEGGSKKETIENLRSLRNILEKENFMKKMSVTDKRYSVIINLSICLLALIGFGVNLAVTPNAKNFYFSTPIGLLCFLIGIGAIIATILLSIEMTKKKKE